MNLLLKYKDKIVSFGLLPIIITLIGIHLFPTTAMLGTGLAISIAGLLYDVLRLKGLNFFLLQGTIGIGVCFLLRLFTGYDYIPKNSLTPSLEFMLLVCAFIHVTAPEIYRNFLKKFHLNFTSSYLLEAKIIVIFSSIHLIILFFLYNKLIPFSPENNFGIIYLIPTLIYVICLVINIVGIQRLLPHNLLKINISYGLFLSATGKYILPRMLKIQRSGMLLSRLYLTDR